MDGKSVAFMPQRNLAKELLYHDWEKKPCSFQDVSAVTQVNSDLFSLSKNGESLNLLEKVKKNIYCGQFHSDQALVV